MSENCEICDECTYEIDSSDEAVLLHHAGSNYLLHLECAEQMVQEGRISQEELDDATPYDVDEQASYAEQYRNPWSW